MNNQQRAARRGGVEMKMMRLQTHADNEKIPVNMAILTIDDNGFVGTNNGWPHVGQPALYPLAQAEAIAVAWNYVAFLHPSLDEMPGWHDFRAETKAWFDIENQQHANRRGGGG